MAEKPIKILLLISNLEYGGAQRQIVELANNIDLSRFEVHVCSLSDYVPLGGRLLSADQRLHIIHKKHKYDFTVVPQLVKLLKKLEIDIVHSYLFDADIAARLAGRMAGVRAVVCSERNTDYHLKKIQLAAYKVTSGMVDLIVANSRAGAEFNSRMLGHDMSMYRVVYNGVDTQQFHPQKESSIRAELGLKSESMIVGMFASFKEQKNHGLFFRAVSELLNKIPCLEIVLVGDKLYSGMHGSDEHMDKINALVGELGIRDKCTFLGNRDDVAVLYNMCDITVLSSLFEGTPNVLLESMACGTPVVATNVSDNSLIVKDGETGFIVPLGDEEALSEKMFAILSDESLLRAMGESCLKWVQAEFSTKMLARNTENIYHKLMLASAENV